jgi:hypothetical protein
MTGRLNLQTGGTTSVTLPCRRLVTFLPGPAHRASVEQIDAAYSTSSPTQRSIFAAFDTFDAIAGEKEASWNG